MHSQDLPILALPVSYENEILVEPLALVVPQLLADCPLFLALCRALRGGLTARGFRLGRRYRSSAAMPLLALGLRLLRCGIPPARASYTCIHIRWHISLALIFGELSNLVHRSSDAWWSGDPNRACSVQGAARHLARCRIQLFWRATISLHVSANKGRIVHVHS